MINIDIIFLVCYNVTNWNSNLTLLEEYMSFYLIDYENLKKINGFDTLTKDDTVIFFYSQTANTLTFDMHIELGKCLAEKEYFLY